MKNTKNVKKWNYPKYNLKRSDKIVDLLEK